MGTEIYWHGILDYSGRENRRIREVREIHKKVESIKEAAGSLYEAKVGVLKDYDNVWDAEVDAWHRRVEEVSQKGIFAAAQKSHTPMDYLYLNDETKAEELKKYQVLFYPHPTMMNAARAEILKEYTKQGGTLVIGCRSGYKDMTGKCVMDKLPGLLAELTGTDIPEYSFIAPDTGKVTVDWEGSFFQAEVFTDLLEPLEGGKTEAVYTSDYYAGSGALIGHPYGKGKAYYYGSTFTEEAADVFLEKLGVKSPYEAVISLPETCEIAVRRKGDTRYLFILNYEKTEAECRFHAVGTDLYTGEGLKGGFTIPEYGTCVIRLEN